MNSTEDTRKGQVRAGVRKVRIDEDLAGQRIDNFLRRELPGLPRGRLYRILRKGEVRVNGGRVGPDHRLDVGDEVRIPPVRVNAAPEPVPAGRIADIESRIVYEDGRLIVLNKPSGLAVHGGSGISHGAIEQLRAARPELRDLSLVHRLDRETSGCLVLAKKRSALRELHARFRDGAVEKNYLALVAGDWQFGDWLIDKPLLVNHRKSGERHVVISGAGKEARTEVHLSRTFGRFSLVQCLPQTGRTHQLRVHLADAGHPIAGDDRYGSADANREARRFGLKRLFLHAQSIAFPDDSGNELHFTAPLADDLERVLKALDAKGGRRQGRR